MRIRATISAVLEYDIPPEGYLSGSVGEILSRVSVEEILSAEKELLTADPEAFQAVDWKVQVEEVKEDTP